MCSISVEPIPSRISIPNRSRNCANTSAGKGSPADTASRTDDKSTPTRDSIPAAAPRRTSAPQRKSSADAAPQAPPPARPASSPDSAPRWRQQTAENTSHCQARKRKTISKPKRIGHRRESPARLPHNSASQRAYPSADAPHAFGRPPLPEVYKRKAGSLAAVAHVESSAEADAIHSPTTSGAPPAPELSPATIILTLLAAPAAAAAAAKIHPAPLHQQSRSKRHNPKYKTRNRQREQRN